MTTNTHRHAGTGEMTGEQVRALRLKLGLTQPRFWSEIHVPAQRGGLYERGTHRIPRPVQLLITLRYHLNIDLASLEGMAAHQDTAATPPLAQGGETIQGQLAAIRGALTRIENAITGGAACREA